MKIYIASIIISYVVSVIVIKDEVEKLKRKGWLLKKENRIWATLKVWTMFSIPIINIIITLVILLDPETTKLAIESLKKEGKLVHVEGGNENER